MCQFGLKLVKTGFSETRRNIPNDTSDSSADGVLLFFRTDYSLINMSEKTNTEIRFGNQLPVSSFQRSLDGGTASDTCLPLPG